MAKIDITINGKSYPCRPTMGAMLRFKSETGHEVTEMDGGFTEACTYLWCCLVSACRRDHIDFDMSLMDFADAISPEDMGAWSEALQADADEAPTDTGESKKKGSK